MYVTVQKLDESVKIEDPDVKGLPQWKSNDVKVKTHPSNCTKISSSTWKELKP